MTFTISKKLMEKIGSKFNTIRWFSIILIVLGLWQYHHDDSYAKLGSDLLPSAGKANILFREIKEDSLEGIVGFLGDEVPGFDHIALAYQDTVYEMHPGYGQGFYVSGPAQTNNIPVKMKTGVQWQHSFRSFIHNSRQSENSPTISFAAIPIDSMVAAKMANFIKSMNSARYQFIDHSFSALTNELLPDQQKGANGAFTCVGLIEKRQKNPA